MNAVPNVMGAGLHFRNNGSEGGNPTEVKEHWTVGPFPIDRSEHTPPVEFFPYQIAQWVGLEGTWYDSFDVEAFLRRKGVYVDETSQAAIMEIDEPYVPGPEPTLSPSSSSSLTFSGPQSPLSDVQSLESNFFATNVDEMLSHMQTSTADFGKDTDMAFADTYFPDVSAKLIDAGSSPAAFAAFIPQPPAQFTKRTVVLDVEKLVDGKFVPFWLAEAQANSHPALTSETVCLGRGPGYRKDNVEAALNRTLAEAF